MRRKLFFASILLSILLLAVPLLGYAQFTYRPVQVVFAVDTSGSMGDEWTALCQQIDSIVQGLEQKGISVEYEILAISTPFEANGSEACTGGKTIQNVVPSTSINHYEDWGQAIVDLAVGYPWKPDYVRVVVPISDEGPEDGNPIDAADQAIAADAVAAAKSNNVMVSIILGNDAKDVPELRRLAEQIARPTGGTVAVLSPRQDVVTQIVDAITRVLKIAPVVDKVKEAITQDDYNVDYIAEPTTIPTDTLKVEVPYEYTGPQDGVLRFVFAIQKEESGKLQSIQKYNPHVADPTGKETPASYNAERGVYLTDIQDPIPGVYKAIIEATAPQDAGADVVIGVGSKESAPMPAEIPEPFTLGLMGAGLAALGAYWRRRSK